MAAGRRGPRRKIVRATLENFEHGGAAMWRFELECGHEAVRRARTTWLDSSSPAELKRRGRERPPKRVRRDGVPPRLVELPGYVQCTCCEMGVPSSYLEEIDAWATWAFDDDGA